MSFIEVVAGGAIDITHARFVHAGFAVAVKLSVVEPAGVIGFELDSYNAARSFVPRSVVPEPAAPPSREDVKNPTTQALLVKVVTAHDNAVLFELFAVFDASGCAFAAPVYDAARICPERLPEKLATTLLAPVAGFGRKYTYRFVWVLTPFCTNATLVIATPLYVTPVTASVASVWSFMPTRSTGFVPVTVCENVTDVTDA